MVRVTHPTSPPRAFLDTCARVSQCAIPRRLGGGGSLLYASHFAGDNNDYYTPSRRPTFFHQRLKRAPVQPQKRTAFQSNIN